MRYRNLAAAAAIFWVALFLASPRRAYAQSSADTVLEIFENRALKTHAGPRDPQLVSAMENSPIGKAYAAIKPKRSILIYDCGDPVNWCGQVDFSFPSMFQQAALMAGAGGQAPAINTIASAWYQAAKPDNTVDASFSRDLPAFDNLQKTNLQLLAIANRMDLADWKNNQWVGGEIHFVFGPAPPASPPGALAKNLTIAFEFVLPPYNRDAYARLAKIWSDLGQAGSSDYGKNLRDALRQAGFSLAAGDAMRLTELRVRLNHEMTTQWILSETTFDKNQGTFIASPKLEDQVRPNYTPTEFAQFWQQRQANTSVAGDLHHLSITDNLAQKGAFVVYGTEAQRTLGMPSGVCDSPKAESIRNILALQQCTFCHTAETGTLFTHIPNRANGGTLPSKFLIGADGEPHPSLGDLYYDGGAAASKADLTFDIYPAQPSSAQSSAVQGPCTQKADGKTRRMYHDVARRTLFLAALTADNPSHSGSSDPTGTVLSGSAGPGHSGPTLPGHRGASPPSSDVPLAKVFTVSVED